MTSYSDIDIHIINENLSEKTVLLKKNILNSLSSFGFGKIDDPNWEHLDVISKYAERSITEGNQVIDCKYACGDKSINNEVEKIKKKYDTLDRNIRNMFFQWFYLDYYYSIRSTFDIPNVKYCKGGYRELLSFDWFDKLINIYKNKESKSDPETPFIKNAIENMLSNSFISDEQFVKLYEAVNFIVLLRNEILHINQNTEDKGITHLDSKTRYNLWQSSKEFFLNYNISNPEGILELFNNHGSIIRSTKELMWDYILNQEIIHRGSDWVTTIREISNPKISKQRRYDLAMINEDIIGITSIWNAHYTNDPELFNIIANKYLKKGNWEIIASIVCSPLCSPKILHEIATNYAKEIGLEYILRIIGRNPNTNKETLINIINDKNLDKHYKIVAKLRLEKGIDYAIKRAS
jgi:hypothetical protein